MAEPVTAGARLRRDPLLLAFLGWTALATILFFALDGHPVWQVRVFWAFQPPMDLMLAICSWRVARLATGPIRRFWLVLMAVGGLFVVGDTWQSIVSFTPGTWTTTGGAVQTVCFGIGLTAVVVAMLAHPHPTRSGRERLGFWLDSATVLAAGGVVAWCLLATPGTYSRPHLLAVIAATGVSITAAFAAVKMILSGNAPMHRAAAIPMVCSAVVMSIGLVLAPGSAVAVPAVVYLVRFLPTLLINIGPRIQLFLAGRDRTTAFGQRRRKPYSLLPYGAMVVAFGALIVVLPAGVTTRLWGVVAGLVLICALVAVRQLVAFHDNSALIDRLREHEIRLRHQAHFDGLTGLANRTHFHDQVAQALAAPGARVSVLLVDLDGFKSVNDTMGHAAGDTLLMAVADRLRGAIRAADVPARLGGDEFAVLLPDCPATEASHTAERILAALTVPELIDGVPVRAAASIGVATATPGADVSTLLRDADLAMYTAKRRGKGTWLRHAPEMTHATR
ncbi:diguanylate cyclase domain-containing protein [Paractinoplanes maris]|uniref:diguanylate cyclase domain-containing protein n=1 Tax=Paractinoplanes maris TaxID=1734446 RepID=UPI0020216EBD|nr:GGDEF domain-containing protein [Actinoplanes maris]